MPRVWHWRWWHVVVVGCVLVSLPILTPMVLPPGFVLWQIQWTVRSTLRELPKEAERVTVVVEAIYRYKRDRGSWPRDVSELVPKYSQEALSADWRYYRSEDREGGAMLSWQGPMHTKLIYVFPSDLDPQLEEGWHASCEGSPVPSEIQELMPVVNVMGSVE